MVSRIILLFLVFTIGFGSLVEEDKYLRNRLNEELKNIKETKDKINTLKNSSKAVGEAINSFNKIESEINEKYLQANKQYSLSFEKAELKEKEAAKKQFDYELSQIDQIDKETEEYSILAALLSDSAVRQALKEVKPQLDFKEAEINEMKVQLSDVKSLIQVSKEKTSTKSKEEKILADNRVEAEKEQEKVNKLDLMIKMLKYDKISGQKLIDAEEKLKNSSRIHIDKVEKAKTAVTTIMEESADLLKTIKDKQRSLLVKYNDTKQLFISVMTETKSDEYKKNEGIYFNLLRKCVNTDVSVVKAKNTLEFTKEKKQYYLQKCKDSCEEYKEKLEELELNQKQMEQDLKTVETNQECSKLGEKRQAQFKSLEIAESALILDQFKDKPAEIVKKLENSLVSYFKQIRAETNAREYSDKTKINEFEQVLSESLIQKERSQFYSSELENEQKELEELKQKDFELKPEDESKFKEFLELKLKLSSQIKIKSELEDATETEGSSIIWLYLAIGFGVVVLLGGAIYFLLSSKKKDPDESINAQNAKLADLP